MDCDAALKEAEAEDAGEMIARNDPVAREMARGKTRAEAIEFVRRMGLARPPRKTMGQQTPRRPQ